jgi:hypothetical protein
MNALCRLRVTARFTRVVRSQSTLQPLLRGEIRNIYSNVKYEMLTLSCSLKFNNLQHQISPLNILKSEIFSIFSPCITNILKHSNISSLDGLKVFVLKENLVYPIHILF